LPSPPPLPAREGLYVRPRCAIGRKTIRTPVKHLGGLRVACDADLFILPLGQRAIGGKEQNIPVGIDPARPDSAKSKRWNALPEFGVCFDLLIAVIVFASRGKLACASGVSTNAAGQSVQRFRKDLIRLGSKKGYIATFFGGVTAGVGGTLLVQKLREEGAQEEEVVEEPLETMLQ
jgi:hypothetical protein